jgi:hypothetical protein
LPTSLDSRLRFLISDNLAVFRAKRSSSRSVDRNREASGFDLTRRLSTPVQLRSTVQLVFGSWRSRSSRRLCFSRLGLIVQQPRELFTPLRFRLKVENHCTPVIFPPRSHLRAYSIDPFERFDGVKHKLMKNGRARSFYRARAKKFSSARRKESI